MSPSEHAGRIEVREALPGDAALIHRMILAIAADSGQGDRVVSTVDDIVRDGFGTERAFGTLLASLADRVVGMALYYPEYSTWRGQRGCYLLDLYVEPELRSRGVGRRLIAELSRQSGKQGAGYLRLSVDEHSTRARSFYQSLGFAESARDRMLLLDRAGFEAMTLESSDS